MFIKPQSLILALSVALSVVLARPSAVLAQATAAEEKKPQLQFTEGTEKLVPVGTSLNIEFPFKNMWPEDLVLVSAEPSDSKCKVEYPKMPLKHESYKIRVMCSNLSATQTITRTVTVRTKNYEIYYLKINSVDLPLNKIELLNKKACAR